MKHISLAGQDGNQDPSLAEILRCCRAESAKGASAVAVRVGGTQHEATVQSPSVIPERQRVLSSHFTATFTPGEVSKSPEHWLPVAAAGYETIGGRGEDTEIL